VTNDNDADVIVNNEQDADSGDARVADNTTGGDATSGDASNSSNHSVDVYMSNASSNTYAMQWGNGGNNTGTINNTGPDSTNRVVFESEYNTTVSNTNTTNVTVNNSQDADSGDATVRDNTTGGDATTGDASNTSSSSTTVEYHN
jgi:hypothetical protein